MTFRGVLYRSKELIQYCTVPSPGFLGNGPATETAALLGTVAADPLIYLDIDLEQIGRKQEEREKRVKSSTATLRGACLGVSPEAKMSDNS